MQSHFAGRRVLVTGHTGFKGSWLSLWLNELRARVFGYALDPATSPNMFDLAKLGELVDDSRGDVRDLSKLEARVSEAEPDFVFHLAAQPIVRASYDDPVGTMSTNVMGTVNVLEAVRRAKRACTVVIVTTDKCYEDTNGYAARETDPLGGSDPYSASKACAEIVTSSYVRSFFGPSSNVRVATARAGNVIGGGDFAPDRLLPDLVRSVQRKEPLRLRHPESVRPWQHVLEPLSGYLWLAARLAGPDGRSFAEGWNFGPSSDSFRTVLEIAKRASETLSDLPIEIGGADPDRHEMPSLTLSTDKARRRLRWAPVWEIDRAVDETMDWYRAVFAGKDARTESSRQIASFNEDAGKRRMPWTVAETA
ncbi:MAG TPA: CDP-glucose 4,6-dehydratase [Labilithrix sp.]|jgi:CDP-glucose 4,6-dehydratase|nr:CDP-glucose 4,6-dehydratase [Labilithrix sp.]